MIPPPVEAGDAPINISITIKNIVGSFVKPRSILLNPAVLSVDVWNIEESTFPFIFIFPKVSGLLYSTPSIKTNPISNSIAVDTITSFEWTFNLENLLFFSTSNMTGYPNPPSIISKDTVIIINELS